MNVTHHITIHFKQTESTFLTVEKKETSGAWTVVHTDSSWETKYENLAVISLTYYVVINCVVNRCISEFETMHLDRS